jgi:hypothetical protein
MVIEVELAFDVVVRRARESRRHLGAEQRKFEL